MDEYGGFLPSDERELTTFPGIGKATAASLMAFAFHAPSAVIETNIRRVFIHCFFSGRDHVTDREILPLVMATCDRENPREWYYALMDLGSTLKRKIENPNRRSASYQRQSPFQGSDRMVRGRILALLVSEHRVAEQDIPMALGFEDERIFRVLPILEKEGFIKRDGRIVEIR